MSEGGESYKFVPVREDTVYKHSPFWAQKGDELKLPENLISRESTHFDQMMETLTKDLITAKELTGSMCDNVHALGKRVVAYTFQHIGIDRAKEWKDLLEKALSLPPAGGYVETQMLGAYKLKAEQIFQEADFERANRYWATKIQEDGFQFDEHSLDEISKFGNRLAKDAGSLRDIQFRWLGSIAHRVELLECMHVCCILCSLSSSCLLHWVK